VHARLRARPACSAHRVRRQQPRGDVAELVQQRRAQLGGRVHDLGAQLHGRAVPGAPAAREVGQARGERGARSCAAHAIGLGLGRPGGQAPQRRKPCLGACHHGAASLLAWLAAAVRRPRVSNKAYPHAGACDRPPSAMVAPGGPARRGGRVAAVVRQAGRRQQVRVPADGQVAGQLPAEHARIEPARPASRPARPPNCCAPPKEGSCWLQALFNPAACRPMPPMQMLDPAGPKADWGVRARNGQARAVPGSALNKCGGCRRGALRQTEARRAEHAGEGNTCGAQQSGGHGAGKRTRRMWPPPGRPAAA
jgi:hypothetical protein